MPASPLPDAWLRGPVAGVPTALMPVAHALLQAAEDVERVCPGLSREELWLRPGGAAAAGYHLKHLAGSLDRLMAYARGDSLSPAQRAALASEQTPEVPGHPGELAALVRSSVEAALAQLRATSPEHLDEPRAVGRAGLPSSVRGLLFHASEHTARHAGQVITTVKILRGLRDGPRH